MDIQKPATLDRPHSSSKRQVHLGGKKTQGTSIYFHVAVFCYLTYFALWILIARI